MEDYRGDDDEFADSGYSIEDAPEDAGSEVDFDGFDDDGGNDDDFSFDMADGMIDTDEEGE